MRFFMLILPIMSAGVALATNMCLEYGGIQNKGFCCAAGCGTCGGLDCWNRGNGLTKAECCTTDIGASGKICSGTQSAPCLLSSEVKPATATTTTTSGSTNKPDPTCANGVIDGKACCPKACATCGGPGCSKRGAGCCSGKIILDADSCDSQGAPCLISSGGGTTAVVGGTTPAVAGPTTVVAASATTCGGVASGLTCCNAGCGTCGGPGCGSRGEGCCKVDATALCSVTNKSPCIMASAITGTGTGTATGGTTAAATCKDYKNGAAATIEIKADGGIVYVRGGGCATLTDIYNAQGQNNPAGPLFVLNASDQIVQGPPTGRWLLARNVFVEQDSLLQIHGSAAAGDANVLRIKSTSTEFYEIRGHGGNLSFKNTKVTSWDTSKGAVRTDYKKGRSFIRCISEQIASPADTCTGKATKNMGECNMDIVNSEMGHLGYFASESYGLTWKVRGYCTNGSNPEVFERTQVTGDIMHSDIYGMYYGHYSYGHQGGQWMYNKMHDNIQYGFDPHDDSDYLEIAYNTVYNNGNHGIIASKRCNNVKIHHNTVYNGGEKAVGIFLHRSSDFAEVYDNHVYNMQDAGMAIMESSNNNVYNNKFEEVKYGIRLSLGSRDNQVIDNTFKDVSAYGLYTYKGSDPVEASKDIKGYMVDNLFDGNNVEGGVKIQQAKGVTISGNTFQPGARSEYRFDDASGIVWKGNTVPANTCFKMEKSSVEYSDVTLTSCY